jgi:hypothetical protein
VASSFERVRQKTGDVAAASWSNMSSRHTELTRVNKSPRPHGTAEGERDSLFLRRYQSATLTGPRQSMVFSGTKRRTKRPLKPPFERDIRIDGGHGGARQTGLPHIKHANDATCLVERREGGQSPVRKSEIDPIQTRFGRRPDVRLKYTPS